MADIDELKTIRMKALVKVWYDILVALKADQIFVFNLAIATDVVNHYVDDLDFLKRRYGITDRAQPPKVAGLMANAILKYRPLVPRDGRQKDIEGNTVNETLAIYHGICVCAEHQTSGADAMVTLFANPQFKDWHNRFIFMLRERNYTSENLIMVFETLCLMAFPESLTKDVIIL